MTLSQRRWCVRLWSVMAIALLALFGAVLIVRERLAEAAHALSNG